MSSVKTCVSCKNPCEVDTILLRGEPYHRNCLVCNVCMDVLDKDLYEHEGKFYCEQDYNTLFGKKCVECGAMIEGEYTTVNDNAYHPGCLKCSGCRQVIEAGADFAETAGGILCSHCIPKVCPQCDKYVHSDASKNPDSAEGVDCSGDQPSWFHLQCLKCDSCSESLTSSNFYSFNGRPYCSQHYEKMTSSTVELINNCTNCGKKIIGQGIKALEKQWHPECFNCSICCKPIKGQFIYQKESLYCQEDYEQSIAAKCSICSKGITGKFVELDGKQLHSACLKCFTCKNSFEAGQPVNMRNGNTYHQHCLT